MHRPRNDSVQIIVRDDSIENIHHKNILSNMASDILSSGDSKKRRIMIITGDESIIEQIQNSNNPSLIKSYIIEPKEDDNQLCYSPFESETQLSNQKKTKHGSLTCVVCGSPALGYNFDAITCESCKAFFRRNALKNLSTSQCRRKGGCEITSETRRRCSACRLAKCLSKGMKRERLLTAEEKAAKRRKIEENRSLTLQNHHDIDTEKSQLLSPGFLNQLSTLEETNLLCLTDFTDLLPKPSPQPQQALLSSEDIQRVETIQNSYNQRIELAARDGLPWNPSVYSTTLLQHLNSRSVPALRLLTFFRQIPEFNELNVDDKVTLIKYNLMPLALLNSTLSYNIETNRVRETDSDVPFDYIIWRTVHGNEFYLRIKKIFDSFVRIAQYDPKIIQLALIALILTKGFSADSDTNEPILNDNIAVYRAQNYYTELLWRYMETVHGSVKSVCIFNELVVHFMSWQTILKELRVKILDRLSPAELNELLPIMKSLLHIP